MDLFFRTLLFIFLISSGISSASSSSFSSPSSVASFDRAQKNKLVSFGETDIMNLFMHESLLVNCRFETLTDMFETECDLGVEYEGPKNELMSALEKKTGLASLEDLTPALFHAYLNHQNKSIKFMLSCLTDRFDELIEFIESESESVMKYSPEFIEFIKSVERSFDIDKNYVFVNYADYSKKTRPHIPLEDLLRLAPRDRLPMAINHILEASIPEEEINSAFIKANVLSRFDLHTMFILYELEVMDMEHSHDLDGSIEKHLKGAMFFEKNNVMAFLALEMFNQECWQALKLIIDCKFGYDSPIRSPVWFQDLYCLREYAMQNSFPRAFFEKVKELATPAALRRLQKRIKASYNHSFSYFFDDEEELEVVQFFQR